MKVSGSVRDFILSLIIALSALAVMLLGGRPARVIELGSIQVYPYIMLLPFIVYALATCVAYNLRSLLRVFTSLDYVIFHLFLFLLTVSAFWSLDVSPYFWEKLLGIFASVAISYYLGICIGIKKSSFNLFIVFLLLGTTAISLLYLVIYFAGSLAAIYKTFSVDYLGFSRIITIGAIVSFATWLSKRFCLICHTSVLVFLHIFTLLLIGGRGPLIALIVSILFVGAILCVTNSRICILFASKPFLATIFVAGLAALFINPDNIENNLTFRTLERFKHFSLESDSIAGRLSLIDCAIEQGKESPLIGKGLAAFFLDCGRTGMSFDYPHNIFVELFSEQGLLGLFIFIFLLLIATSRLLYLLHLIKTVKAVSYAPELTVIMMFVFSLIEAQFSSDIVGNRYLFFSMALVTTYALKSARSKSKSKSWPGDLLKRSA